MVKYNFEWDSKKAKFNLGKHKISFKLAAEIFINKNHVLERTSKNHNCDEIRKMAIGKRENGTIIIIFTIRNKGKSYRIISARKANKKEKEIYMKITDHFKFEDAKLMTEKDLKPLREAYKTTFGTKKKTKSKKLKRTKSDTHSDKQ